jgi:post-segregation antitoxin (ccd killing protein)
MFELLTDPWFILAGVLGVASSLLVGRFQKARHRKREEQWRAEERERIDEINKSIGGRDG